MTHAENAVPALQKRNTAKRPHDVIADRGERLKSNRADGGNGRCVQAEHKAVFPEPAVPQYSTRHIPPHVQPLTGQGNIPVIPVADNLNAAGPHAVRRVNRGNDR